jgi:hypothetical protein
MPQDARACQELSNRQKQPHILSKPQGSQENNRVLLGELPTYEFASCRTSFPCTEAWISVNIAVLTAIPSASPSTASVLNRGSLASIRTAKRRSRAMWSHNIHRPDS